MLDIVALLERGRSQMLRVASNPLAQIGKKKDPYLGLQLMPERIVEENQFTETRINYRTLVANDATDYSPVQLKGGAFVGEFDVKLRSSDVGSDFTAQEYEAVIKILARFTGGEDEIPMQALMKVLKWEDSQLVQPLVVKNELRIWQGIEKAVIKRTGDNDFKEDVLLPNPPGHRVAALGAWSDPTYNPFDDIDARSDFAISKNQRVRVQYAGKSVINKLLNNPIVQRKVGGYINVTNQGALIGNNNRPTLAAVNAYLAENEQAPIVPYNKQYFDADGPHFFLSRDVFVQICETDQSEELVLANGDTMLIENTLGYTGIGRNAGRPTPGRTLVTKAHEDKPPRIEGEMSQKSFLVNQNPEAVNVIFDIQ